MIEHNNLICQVYFSVRKFCFYFIVRIEDVLLYG